MAGWTRWPRHGSVIGSMRGGWTAAWIAGIVIPMGCVGPPPSPPQFDSSGPGPVNDGSTGSTGTTSGGLDASGTEDSSTSSSTTDASTTAAACEPPCMAGSSCIDGRCVSDGGSSSSGGWVGECGLAFDLGMELMITRSCVDCLEGQCCAELQGCFGDETTTRRTECHELNACILAACAGAGSAERLQSCAQVNCSESYPSYEQWLAYQQCAAASCLARCT